MRILFDHGTPDGLANLLEGHEVDLARTRGWDRLSNGELLRAAENEGFELLITTDSNMRYQQNLAQRNIAVLVLMPGTWSVVQVRVDDIRNAVRDIGTNEIVELRLP